MDQKKVIPVLVITGGMTIFGTLLYKSFLYGEEGKKKESKQK